MTMDMRGVEGRRYRRLREEGRGALDAWRQVKWERDLVSWFASVDAVSTDRADARIIIDMGEVAATYWDVFAPAGISHESWERLYDAGALVHLSIGWDDDPSPAHEWGEIRETDPGYRPDPLAVPMDAGAGDLPTRWYVPESDYAAAPRGMDKHRAQLVTREIYRRDGEMLTNEDREVYYVFASVEVAGEEVGAASLHGIEVGRDGHMAYVYDCLRDAMAEAVADAEASAERVAKVLEDQTAALVSYAGSIR